MLCYKCSNSDRAHGFGDLAQGDSNGQPICKMKMGYSIAKNEFHDSSESSSRK